LHPDTVPSLDRSKLFYYVHDSLAAIGFSDRVALLAAFFVFSSWFVDQLIQAPYLWVVGPRPEGRFFLEYLAQLVPNPILITGPITKRGLLSAGTNPRRTVLIDDAELGNGILALLRSTCYPQGASWLDTAWQPVCFSKAVYRGPEVDESHLEHGALQVNLDPLRGQFLTNCSQSRGSVATEFHSNMRAMRKKIRAAVAEANLDVSGYTSEVGMLMQTLGAPFANEPEILVNLRNLLGEYQREREYQRWADPSCVVIEALVYRCHDRGGTGNRLQVGEIAKTANTIMMGRGETTALSARYVGGILRKFDLFAKRNENGFGLQLSEYTRRRIHDLAHKFEVLNHAAACSHCNGRSHATGGDNADARTVCHARQKVK
jgi:hypothetical protein